MSPKTPLPDKVYRIICAVARIKLKGTNFSWPQCENRLRERFSSWKDPVEVRVFHLHSFPPSQLLYRRSLYISILYLFQRKKKRDSKAATPTQDLLSSDNPATNVSLAPPSKRKKSAKSSPAPDETSSGQASAEATPTASASNKSVDDTLRALERGHVYHGDEDEELDDTGLSCDDKVLSSSESD